ITDASFDTADSSYFPNLIISGAFYSFYNADYFNFRYEYSYTYVNGDMFDAIAGMLAGNDTITGSSGDDHILGFGGDDILEGRSGADVLDGGSGTNTASYATASAGVIASLGDPGINTGDAAGDTYFSIQNLVGSAYNDSLYGNDGPNALSGGGGND